MEHTATPKANPFQHFVVSSLQSVFTVYSQKGRALEMKNRATYALTFAVGDACIVYTKDGKSYASDSGHAILIPMGADYRLTTTRTGEFPLINFIAKPEVEDFLRIPLSHPEGYLKDYERLREAWVVRGDFPKAMSILYELFTRLSHESTDDRYRTIRPAAEYVATHFSDPTLQNGALAAETGLSEVYFRRLFKEAYGVSPKQYLIDIRIRNARQMLAETPLSITEIADACGFSSVYHFCRAFKNAIGETPTAYRKKERL